MGSVNPEDALMRFRTAWLSAIALAWEDSTFRGHLLSDPKAALSTIGGFQWPWDGIVDLKVSEDKKFVWKDSPKAGWKWPILSNPDEWLVMNVPLLPKDINDKVIADADQPSALADYYRGQPTLFGASNAPTVKSLVVTPTGPSFVGPGTDFMNFEVVLVLLISDRWKNCKKLGSTPFDPKTLKAALKQHAKKYRIPWALSISVLDDPTIRWDQQSGTWKNPTPHMLQLELPTAPQNTTSRTVALAEYNATGSEYPFTCCCA
jgi:ribosomally synthesized peptide (two-chain TOMM family)